MSDLQPVKIVRLARPELSWAEARAALQDPTVRALAELAGEFQDRAARHLGELARLRAQMEIREET